MQLLVVLTIALFMSFPCWASSIESDLAKLEKVAVGCAGVNTFAWAKQKEGKEKALLSERVKYWRLIAQTVSKTKDVNDAIIKQVSLFSERLNAGSMSKDDLINLMARCEDFQERLPKAKTPANET